VSDEPFRLHAQNQHITARMVREIFLLVDRRHFQPPDLAKVHPVQRIAWLNCHQRASAVVKDLPEGTKLMSKEFTPVTMGGIPCKEDGAIPDDAIWFYIGNDLVATITNLAKPPGL
jgi:hypothetical protein